MTFRKLLVGKSFKTLKYQDGLLMAIIGDMPDGHAQDIEHDRCQVVDQGLVTDAAIDRFLADGWVFTSNNVLTKAVDSNQRFKP
ncbi:MAG: hypothetical protein QM811_03610 [Pirellulales bacterium]